MDLLPVPHVSGSDSVGTQRKHLSRMDVRIGRSSPQFTSGSTSFHLPFCSPSSRECIRRRVVFKVQEILLNIFEPALEQLWEVVERILSCANLINHSRRGQELRGVSLSTIQTTYADRVADATCVTSKDIPLCPRHRFAKRIEVCCEVTYVASVLDFRWGLEILSNLFFPPLRHSIQTSVISPECGTEFMHLFLPPSHPDFSQSRL
ncbi:hypothetical protein V8E55_011703 [Tylopilus felleus]